MKRRYTQLRAFTLLELLVVLVLVAILSAVVVMRLSGIDHAFQRERAVGQWMLVDRQLRHHSDRFHRPLALTFELQDRTLARFDLNRTEPIGALTVLPNRIRIDRYISSATGKTSHRGKIEIQYRLDGQTDTYAVCLAEPEKQETWLLFLGVTGEPISGLTESEIHEAIRLASN